ncbi:MAG: PIN domain-containing protein [Zavarzinella sp.]|nr:PIN domain-containing protein [Zavarzinella sp.]
MNAVDTNVFVYALDVDEPVKQTKAQQLLKDLTAGADPTVLLWQVAGELLSNLRKRESAGRITATDVQMHFDDFLAMFPLVTPGAAVFPRYFDLHARFSLSHWDAMLLAACREVGVTTLYSEDMDAGTDYDGLKIVNPFA